MLEVVLAPGEELTSTGTLAQLAGTRTRESGEDREDLLYPVATAL